MKRPRKPLPRSTARIRRSRVKRSNAKRKAKNFQRAYGSKERVAFVKSLACAVYGRPHRSIFGWHTAMCLGPIQNAHIEGGGAGRKADAAKIIPLCRSHHDLLHRIGRPLFEEKYGRMLRAVAEQTEAAWRAHHAGEP